MSRWFRHYAGMMRDDKLVRAALRAKQPVERVVWVWGAILESAAEIDDGGRYEIDYAEIAYFLRTSEEDIAAIADAICELGRTREGVVVKWRDRQFQSDRSAGRTKRYRDRQKEHDNCAAPRSRDDDVTSQERHCDAPETETETETEKKVSSGSNEPSESHPKRVRVLYSEDFEEKFWKPYPRTPVMSKTEAWKAWGKLSEPDRLKAIAAVPQYVAWLQSKPDHPAVHACRFLSQRRFDGFEITSIAAGPEPPPGLTEAQIADWYRGWKPGMRSSAELEAEYGT